MVQALRYPGPRLQVSNIVHRQTVLARTFGIKTRWKVSNNYFHKVLFGAYYWVLSIIFPFLSYGGGCIRVWVIFCLFSCLFILHSTLLTAILNFLTWNISIYITRVATSEALGFLSDSGGRVANWVRIGNYSRPSGNSKFSKQRRNTMSVTLRRLACRPSYPLGLLARI